jgi:hypothetical protein
MLFSLMNSYLVHIVRVVKPSTTACRHRRRFNQVIEETLENLLKKYREKRREARESS